MQRDKIRIGEVAARVGVSIQTLRYYERRGLIQAPARRPSGYREYSHDIVRVVRFIKWAQRLGFTLEEVRELLGLFEGRTLTAGPGIRSRAADKIRDIDEEIRRLQATREALEAIASCSCEDKCPIISEALGDGAIKSGQLRRLL